MGTPWSVLLAILVAHAVAVAAIAPGTYTLRFPLRTDCGSAQGLLSTFDCATNSNKVSLQMSNAGTGRQTWTLEPLTAGIKDITNKTIVQIKVGGRNSCVSYLSYPRTCAGTAFLQAKVPSDARQRWLVEPWGAMFRLRPVLCPNKWLGFNKTCSAKLAQVLPVSASTVVASTFTRVISGSVTPTSKVNVTLEQQPGWNNRWEGAFLIKNSNNYSILSWEMAFKVAGTDNFTWGPSDVDLTWSAGGVVKMVPKDWLKEIAAGTTLRIGFGFQGSAPTGLQFTQILPLLDPNNDPSLKTRGTFPAKVFAPFVDAVLYPTPQLLDFQAATGQKWYTLAFVVADIIKKVPSWGGVIGMEKQYFVDQIRDIRLKGGDVIISFGGASGQELAQVISNEDALVAAYQSVIDLYKLRWIDFDIEGGAVAQPASIDLRNRALKRIQAANPGLTISYTLPVLPTGLTAAGVALLANAVQRGLRVDVVNIMTMDYGDVAAPNPTGNMGNYSIQAAQNTYQQALGVKMNTKIGVTPMIGKNDVETEIFDQAAARQVAAWAKATPWVRWTAFWSMGRDRWDPAETYVSIHSSSIPQQPLEFTNIFKRYAS
ncbi:hypothetical protein ABPG77_006174 [Micractinium sp. CCAP 211/92]